MTGGFSARFINRGSILLAALVTEQIKCVTLGVLHGIQVKALRRITSIVAKRRRMGRKESRTN